jgi:DNA-directed RNA polymerase I and III subunit RPAC2
MDSDTDQQQDTKFDYTQRPELEIQRQDADNTSATYSFLNEDHTLGNLLRNVIIKNSHVEFCAYSVPHPSEPVMNVRLQVDKAAGDTKKVLRHGLKRISKMSDVLTEKFNIALEKFEKAQMTD